MWSVKKFHLGTRAVVEIDRSRINIRRHRGGPDKIKLDSWVMEQFAYLVGKMKLEKEGDGSSLLDNAVVLGAKHMASGGSHSIDNAPFLLAGRCGNYFNTGQSVSQVIPHTAVLKEMILAMGVDPAGFFEPQYNLDFAALRAKA